MAPMIPSYDDLADGRIEEILRERAFAEGADLWVGRREEIAGPEEWRAAYRIYGPAVGRSRDFSELTAVTAPTKRRALIALAQIDDIGTII